MGKKWKASICKNEEERMRFERIAELSEDIRVHNKEVRLDFSKPEHRELYLLQFGGEEYYKREFPKHYAMYEKTMLAACEAQNETGSKETVNAGEEPEFHDAAQIVYFYMNEDKEGRLYTETALEDVSEQIIECIKIYNQVTGEVIWYKAYAAYNTNCTKGKWYIRNILDIQKGNLVLCDYMSTWIDGNTQTFKTSIYSYTLDLTLTSCVEKVVMTNPIHKKTPADSEIVVCYNRKAALGEGVDYDDYQEAFDPATGKQKLFLDVSGEVTLKEEHRPYQWMDLTNFVLKLYCDSGFAQYNIEGRQQDIEKCFQKTDTGFSFALDKDWEGVVPAARLPIVEDVRFLLSFYFTTATTKGSILISSDLDPEEITADRQPISKLHLLWGCVEENTDVVMADGTTKKIKDIQVGEKVMARDGNSHTVKEIMRGVEERLLHLETADGQTLVCTREHPILTKNGMKPAYMLKGDDVLIRLGNQETTLTALYEAAGGKVYSLWLEAEEAGEQVILTNGLYTGDFVAQNEVMKKVTDKKGMLKNQKPDEETLKLMKYFKGEPV